MLRLMVLAKTKPLMAKEKSLVLPGSGATIKMVVHSAPAMFASLLSDPHLNQDENMLFRNNDPLAPPPERDLELKDINTGRCYRKTWKDLIKDPTKEILLPTPTQMDKIAINANGRLTLEPFNVCLGIHNLETRRRPEGWRPIGYMNTESINMEKRRGMKRKAGDPPVVLSDSCYKLQDYHAMMIFLLKESGFLELQRRGFKWKLKYRGKVYDVVFRMYMPFIIADSECHDRLCGIFTMRSGSTKYICRICETPFSYLAWSKAGHPGNFGYRLPSKAKRLMNRGTKEDMQELRNWSMQYLPNNVFNHLRVGSHNNRGGHGACPPEILHVILLGHYKRLLAIVFDQIGSTQSKAYGSVTNLCIMMGKILQRQSDRDVPRTNFSNGFSSGANLMGHEIPGCLLVLLLVLHCEDFAAIFPAAKTKKGTQEEEETFTFSNKNHRHDWQFLIESYMQMEQWIKSELLPTKEVRQFGTAAQWLMRQTKFIAPRCDGTNHRTIKFHFLIHLMQDMLDLGPMCNTDSAPCESNHKVNAKDCAQHTQLRKETLPQQTSGRYVENQTISKAWKTVFGLEPADKGEENEVVATSGTGWLVYRRYKKEDDVSGRYKEDGTYQVRYDWTGRQTAGRILVPNELLTFIDEYVLGKLDTPRVYCATQHTRGGQIFRAHPNYHNRPWNDHALFDWGGGSIPELGRIMTFVCIDLLAHGETIEVNDAVVEESGVYALIQTYRYCNMEGKPYDNEEERLEDWEHDPSIVRRLKRRTDEDGVPLLCLANVESIYDTATVVDNIGSKDGNDFLYLEKRSEWKEQWVGQMGSLYDKYVIDQEVESQEEEDMSDFEEKFEATKKEKAKEVREKSQATRKRNRKNREASRR